MMLIGSLARLPLNPDAYANFLALRAFREDGTSSTWKQVVAKVEKISANIALYSCIGLCVAGLTCATVVFFQESLPSELIYYSKYALCLIALIHWVSVELLSFMERVLDLPNSGYAARVARAMREQQDIQQAFNLLHCFNSYVRERFESDIIILTNPECNELCYTMAERYVAIGSFGRAFDLIPQSRRAQNKNRQRLCTSIIKACQARFTMIDQYLQNLHPDVRGIIHAYWLDISDAEYGVENRAIRDKLRLVQTIAESLRDHWTKSIGHYRMGMKSVPADTKEAQDILNQFINKHDCFKALSVEERGPLEPMILFLQREPSATIRVLRLCQWRDEREALAKNVRTVRGRELIRLYGKSGP